MGVHVARKRRRSDVSGVLALLLTVALGAPALSASSFAQGSGSDYDVAPSSGDGSALPDDLYRAPNPAQRFDVFFDGAGLRVVSTASGAADRAPWSFRYLVLGLGTSRGVIPLDAPTLSAHGGRIRFVRTARFQEAYVNHAGGLDSQFVIESASEVSDGDGLHLTFGLSGDLLPQLSPDGRVLELFTAAGELALLWTGLTATDAADRTIDATMELSDPAAPGDRYTLDIRLSTTDAAFPVTLSDTLSAATGGTFAPTSTSHLVISEIQTNGDGGTPADDEFVELYNPTSSPVSISGWSLQYRSTSGTFLKQNVTTGTVPAYGFYLMARAAYNGSPAADLIYNQFSMSGSAGSVFLVNNQVLLTTCSSAAIVDQVAYGSGTNLCPETTASTPAPAANGSIERAPGNSNPPCGNGTDTGNNSADFLPRTTSQPQSSASLTESCADVSAAKTDNPDPVNAGATLTYTVTVSNAGPDDATNAAANDTLPTGVTFVSTTGCSNDPLGVPTCNLGTIAASGSKIYTIVTTVGSNVIGPTLSNSVNASSPAFDANGTNNSSTQATTVTTSADLSITKTDSPDPVATAQFLTYTVTVTNAGPSDAAGVSVSDTLPGLVSFLNTNGCAEDPGGVPTCALGTIVAGGQKSYTIKVDVHACTGSLSNSATVSSTTPDANSSNNSASATTAVTAACDDGNPCTDDS